MIRERRRRGRPAGVLVAAVVLGVAASSCSNAGGPGDSTGRDGATRGASPSVADDSADDSADDDSSSTGPSTERRTVLPSQAERVGAVVPEEPDRIRLPGTSWLDVAAVDSRANGVLDVPANVDRLGWWEGGARIGDPFGSVLIAGHVDSTTQGLGPSAVLLEVAEGERVQVGTQSRTTTYAVRSRRLVPRDDLESYPGILSPRGPARLVLVTCAPPFVAGQGGYQNLAVVEARPLDGAARSSR